MKVQDTSVPMMWGVYLAKHFPSLLWFMWYLFSFFIDLYAAMLPSSLQLFFPLPSKFLVKPEGETKTSVHVGG